MSRAAKFSRWLNWETSRGLVTHDNAARDMSLSLARALLFSIQQYHRLTGYPAIAQQQRKREYAMIADLVSFAYTNHFHMKLQKQGKKIAMMFPFSHACNRDDKRSY